MGSLMAVFAHPDDETFICGGTLAKYAAEGHRVVLVSATKGEMGRRMGVPPTATRETIAQLRERELQEACEALRISQLYFLGLRDKSLEIQPFDELVQTVYTYMEQERPEVIITFHEKFGGHPDHCTIGAAATRAFAAYHEHNPDSKLYFIAWSGMADNPQRLGLTQDQFKRINVSQFAQEKLLAFRAHRTQSEMIEGIWGSDEQGRRNLSGEEFFIQYLPPFDKKKKSDLW